MTAVITVMMSNAIFQINRFPAAFLNVSSSAVSEIPAINVPDGQMYLQNHGLPWPMMSVTASGSMITNIINIAYFSFTRIL